ncbi:MAG: hypothetical protein LC797_12320, partial [Chloroflexi bacterium]|nr:hypothetical protein [Chloroflexota bacterium]
YAQLEHAPVPVEVVGWVVTSEPRVELLPNGYMLSVRADELGQVTIAGQRAAAPALPGAATWREGDVTYALQTTADLQLVRPLIVSVTQAEQQIAGSPWDTPVLYLFYLPALLGFGAWATWSLLLRPPAPP